MVGFDVFFESRIYSHPQSRTVENALILWCVLIRNKCQSKAFSMDFTPICEKLLDRVVEIDNSRTMDGMFELEDD